MKKTNNKLGKGATNTSARPRFSASHSLVPAPFSSLGISGAFCFKTVRQNPQITLPIINPYAPLTQTAKTAQSLLYLSLYVDCAVDNNKRIIISLQTHSVCK